MTDKLEALSQPFAWTDPDAIDYLKAGKWACVFPEKYQDSFPLYSQEYVTALIKRAEAAEQREEHLKAAAAVMGQRIAELEQQSEATQQGVQILTEAIGAHGYIVGCLERNRPDLALEEALKWVSVFAQAAEQVEGE